MERETESLSYHVASSKGSDGTLEIHSGKIERAVCIRLPYNLHRKVRKHGINMTKTSVQALEQAVEQCERMASRRLNNEK